MIRSYAISKERELRVGSDSPYAQRLWWGIYSEKYGLVKQVGVKCRDKSIGQAYVKAWQTDDKTYVTILKRFEKPTSALGLQDWLSKHFDRDVQGWDFLYWKPTCVEIVYRRLRDDNNIQEDPQTLSPLLWNYTPGLHTDVYYFKDDKSDNSLVLSEQED
jgi:hypothetical protein